MQKGKQGAQSIHVSNVGERDAPYNGRDMGILLWFKYMVSSTWPIGHTETTLVLLRSSPLTSEKFP